MNTKTKKDAELLPLAELRKVLGYSQSELAKVLNISRGQVSMAEGGRRKLNSASMKIIRELNRKHFEHTNERFIKKPLSVEEQLELSELSDFCHHALVDNEYQFMCAQLSLRKCKDEHKALLEATNRIKQYVESTKGDIMENHKAVIKQWCHQNRITKCGHTKQFNLQLKIAMLTAGAAFTKQFILDHGF